MGDHLQMWRFVMLAALGLVIGAKARSERAVVLYSLFFGLVYGGLEVLSAAMGSGRLSPGRGLFLLGLGLVIAAPVYAVGELWRRTRSRVLRWLWRLLQRFGF